MRIVKVRVQRFMVSFSFSEEMFGVLKTNMSKLSISFSALRMESGLNPQL